MVDSEVKPAELPDWLIGNGRIWVTTAEIAELLDVSPVEVGPIAARWRAKNRAFSPTRGAYVPIPAEYRTWGAVPANYFIDPMMRHLGHPYYVAYLTAATAHGAAHQKPQVFQVITSARLDDRSFERVHLEFTHAGEIEGRPTVTVRTPTGNMTVSSPETTVLDLVTTQAKGGGLSNISTVIIELLEDGKLDSAKLATAATAYPTSSAQRAGWMIDNAAAHAGITFDLNALEGLAAARTEPTPLAARQPRRGPIDRRWNVIVNTEVEPDL